MAMEKSSKSVRFFVATLIEFLVRVMPASKQRNQRRNDRDEDRS